MKLTTGLLIAATGCRAGDAEQFADHVGLACERFGITTPPRLAHFLAQIAHESGALRHVEEIWGPTEAQKTYEGRKTLGNTEPGDGERFKGHGLIQVTGRFNHAAARDRLRVVLGLDVPDFEAGPEQLALPKWAAWSAAEYWAAHGCNELADADDVEAVTRRINGGTNGLADRMKRLERAKAAMSTQSPEPTEAPTAPPEPALEPSPHIQQERPMLPAIPLLTALLPTLVDAIPKLAGIFKPGSPVERNVKAATTVFEIAKTALGAVNEQEVVQRMATDPAAVATVSKAIEAQWYSITEAGGGGIEGARKADQAYTQGPAGFWHSPAFWITVALLPLVYLATYAVLIRGGFSSDIQAMVLGALFGGLLTGGISSFWFGTSASSQRKTELLSK